MNQATTPMPSKGPSFYKIIGVERSATEDEIRQAYRRRALQCHPDKPGGSVQLFNRLQGAYDTLKDKAKRAKYDQEWIAQRKKKMFKAPVPVEDPRKPVTYPLPDGTTFDFETAPDRLRNRFRHGDMIRHSDGTQGVFIGISGDGCMFWCPLGTNAAVPFNTFGGERDIVIMFRQPATQRGATRTPTRRASSATRTRPTKHVDPHDDEEGGGATFASTWNNRRNRGAFAEASASAQAEAKAEQEAKGKKNASADVEKQSDQRTSPQRKTGASSNPPPTMHSAKTARRASPNARASSPLGASWHNINRAPSPSSAAAAAKKTATPATATPTATPAGNRTNNNDSSNPSGEKPRTTNSPPPLRRNQAPQSFSEGVGRRTSFRAATASRTTAGTHNHQHGHESAGGTAAGGGGLGRTVSFADARRLTELEKLARQRVRKINISLKQVQADETLRRDAAIRSVEKHFLLFHAQVAKATADIRRKEVRQQQQEAGEERLPNSTSANPVSSVRIPTATAAVPTTPPPSKVPSYQRPLTPGQRRGTRARTPVAVRTTSFRNRMQYGTSTEVAGLSHTYAGVTEESSSSVSDPPAYQPPRPSITTPRRTSGNNGDGGGLRGNGMPPIASVRLNNAWLQRREAMAGGPGPNFEDPDTNDMDKEYQEMVAKALQKRSAGATTPRKTATTPRRRNTATSSTTNDTCPGSSNVQSPNNSANVPPLPMDSVTSPSDSGGPTGAVPKRATQATTPRRMSAGATTPRRTGATTPRRAGGVTPRGGAAGRRFSGSSLGSAPAPQLRRFSKTMEPQPNSMATDLD